MSGDALAAAIGSLAVIVIALVVYLTNQLRTMGERIAHLETRAEEHQRAHDEAR